MRGGLRFVLLGQVRPNGLGFEREPRVVRESYQTVVNHQGAVCVVGGVCMESNVIIPQTTFV